MHRTPLLVVQYYASREVAMRCVCCGCDKDCGAFSGAQKKKAAAKRKCTSCTATGNDGTGSAAASSSSVVSAGVTQLEAD